MPATTVAAHLPVEITNGDGRVVATLSADVQWGGAHVGVVVDNGVPGPQFSTLLEHLGAVAVVRGLRMRIETRGLPQDIERFQRLLNAGWQEDARREGRGRRFTFPHEGSGDSGEE